MQWPASELEFWSLSFSIDADARSPNKKPTLKQTVNQGKAREMDLKESKQTMKEWFDG